MNILLTPFYTHFLSPLCREGWTGWELGVACVKGSEAILSAHIAGLHVIMLFDIDRHVMCVKGYEATPFFARINKCCEIHISLSKSPKIPCAKFSVIR